MKSIFEAAHEIGEHVMRMWRRGKRKRDMEALMLAITHILMRYEAETKQRIQQAMSRPHNN